MQATPLARSIRPLLRRIPARLFAGISVLGVAASTVSTGWAMTFTVDHGADQIDAAIGDGVCASAAATCTFRAAIQEANAQPGADTITFADSVAVVTVAIPGSPDDAAQVGDLDITDDLTIDALDGHPNGVAVVSNLSIFGPPLDRLLDVLAGTVEIDGLDVENFCPTPCATQGGAIRNAATLTLRNLTVTGGLTVGDGGGVYNSGTLMLDRVEIDLNTAWGRGGGIMNAAGGSLSVTRSVVGSLNTARGDGGGIANHNGTLTIANTTVLDNTARGDGGGIWNFADAALTATVDARNLTVINNSADSDMDGAGSGGGIANLSSLGGVADFSLRNTLIGDNTDSGGEAPDCTASPALHSGGYNLFESALGCAFDGDLTGNVIGLAPGILTLFEGFATLAPTSPALDAANPATPGSGGTACEASDQRGLARTPWGDPRCDIGASESSICDAAPVHFDFAPCHQPFVPGRGAFLARDDAADERDTFKWRWTNGEQTDLADFGDPLTADDQRICVYDDTGLVLAASAPAGGTCAGDPCWKTMGSGPARFVYRDEDLTPSGMRNLTLQPGPDGRAKIIAKGTGVPLTLLPLPWVAPVTVQLLNGFGASTRCWEARYSVPTSNDSVRFKAKAD